MTPDTVKAEYEKLVEEKLPCNCGERFAKYQHAVFCAKRLHPAIVELLLAERRKVAEKADLLINFRAFDNSGKPITPDSFITRRQASDAIRALGGTE